ncbi:hypothetical protein N7488_012083 [Penicillium malachiteum]|nr:hypothetical protein N7488_012083 [Penicillium malachiteum]
MYRNHCATECHDKVYALLGLAQSHDTISSGLLPNYETPWPEVFKNVTKHIFPESSIQTWVDTDFAVIKGNGWILGYINQIEKRGLLNGQQRFSVDFTATARVLGYKREWAFEWELQAGGEEIKEGDIICLLQGGSMPSIVRLCKDHFTLIFPAVRPPKRDQNMAPSILLQNRRDPGGLHEMLLVLRIPVTGGQVELESSLKLSEKVPSYLESKTEVDARLDQIASIVLDIAARGQKKKNDNDSHRKALRNNVLNR